MRMKVNSAAMTLLTALNEPSCRHARATAAQPRVAVVHDGARLHYALPVALQHAGALEQVFMNWFVRSGSLEEKVTQVVQRFVPELGRPS